MDKRLKFREKIVKVLCVCMMLFLLCAVSFIVADTTEAKQVLKSGCTKVPEKKNRTNADFAAENAENSVGNVIEVSDLETFTDAARIVMAEDEKAKAEDLWQNNRLLVKSKEGFPTMGAISVVQGYDSLYILTYESNEAAKAAYESLKQIPYLTAEWDYVYCGTAKAAETKDGTYQKKEQEKNSNVVVAVLDTGYDINSYGEKELVSATDMTASGFIQDENGHGTAMANIILKNTQNRVKIMPVKVADATGQTSALKLYMGISYAIEQKADIINISMSAYKASHSEIVNEAIRKAVQAGIFVVVSAGNEGEDVADYSPANTEEAIVVSAVNTDKTLMEYSNYGAYIDYCAYGKIEVEGLGKKSTVYSGTSVSAAIVSGILAKIKEDSKSSFEDVMVRLNQMAEDLGESGRDSLYGVGFLASENYFGLEEKENRDKPKLLTCNWRQLGRKELDEIIWNTPDYYKRKFLDNLSKEEIKELLKDSAFSTVSTTVGYEETKGGFVETFRVKDTLYHYLYSEKFNEYRIQYHLYHYGPDKIYLNTSQKAEKATLTLEYTDHQNEITNEGHIIVRGHSAGAVNLDNVSIGKYKENQKYLLGSDDNGRSDIIMGIKLTGIVASKPKHSQFTGSKKVWTNGTTQEEKNWYKRFEGGYSGNSWNYLKKGSCTGTEVAEEIMFGNGDFEMSQDKKPVTHTLLVTKYATDWDSWGEWRQAKAASCTAEGSTVRTRKAVCENCKKQADTKTETKAIPQLAHTYAAKYADNNGIAKGQYWEECTKNCGGYDVKREFWQRNVKYYQKISYRYMKTDGTYPDYTDYVNVYYDKDSIVPGYQYLETESSEYKSAGIDGYAAKTANHIKIDIPRKKYTIQFDGNGADYGMTASKTLYCGQSAPLTSNGFQREGYQFAGWSKEEGEKALYKDKEEVVNLSYTDGESITLYAVWEAMHTISFQDNLTEKDREILLKGADKASGGQAVTCPKMQWKKKNKDVTIRFEEAVVENDTFRDIYRFLGWSLTPVISGEEEIILSKEKDSYTFTKEEDVVLYAQWDRGFTMAYIGNGQSDGKDYLDVVNAVTDQYVFYPNDKEQLETLPNQTADYFEKFLETSDKERIDFSFQGWSMYADKEEQKKHICYQHKDGAWECAELLTEAKKAGITFGAPAEMFGRYNASHENLSAANQKSNMPYVNLYAIWDEYPQIAAEDIYLSLQEARKGQITEEYLLNLAKATDAELKNEKNTKGELKNGKDSAAHTEFLILDYQASDFLEAESDMSMTITYCAKDAVGNSTTKMVTVYLVDTDAREYDSGCVRFISKQYMDTLSENSVWRTGDYAALLSTVLSNEKSGEVYTKVTPLQRAFGAKSVAKPGSGTWKQVRQIWEFSHEEVLAVRDYVKKHGITESQKGFLTAFRHCRKL